MNTAFHSEWIVPDWPAPPRVRALISTRAGGVSQAPYASMNLGAHVGDEPFAVEKNREILRASLPADPVWMHQVHGNTVVDATQVNDVPSADAAIAQTRHRICAVMSADCMPLLFAASDARVVGVAHAGWRGMAAGVIEATLEAMAIAPADCLVYMGPAIGPAAFEVGQDVFDAFVRANEQDERAFTRQASTGKYLADLYTLARLRLTRAGVQRIYGGGFCTYTDAQRFYSYRRDSRTGRMASLIWLD
jgi:YfiH family protein